MNANPADKSVAMVPVELEGNMLYEMWRALNGDATGSFDHDKCRYVWNRVLAAAPHADTLAWLDEWITAIELDDINPMTPRQVIRRTLCEVRERLQAHGGGETIAARQPIEDEDELDAAIMRAEDRAAKKSTPPAAAGEGAPTPRTDALQMLCGAHVYRDEAGLRCTTYSVVDSRFARQLERELASETARRKEHNLTIQGLLGKQSALEAELASLRGGEPVAWLVLATARVGDGKYRALFLDKPDAEEDVGHCGLANMEAEIVPLYALPPSPQGGGNG